MEIEKVTYLDALNLVPSFVSLDISVKALGWARWIDGVLDFGIYAFKSKEDTDRRQEMRRLVKSIFKGNRFKYLIIEEPIGSCNYKTAKILHQLNVVPDDMVVDGIIHADVLFREDNKKWKSWLRQFTGTQIDIRGLKDKEVILQCAYDMGFTDEVIKKVIPSTTDSEILPRLLASDSITYLNNSSAKEVPLQGIYDALGMAVGVIYKKFIAKEDLSPKKLKTDITKGYKISQFFSLNKALQKANSKGGDLYEVDFTNITKDLKFNFKKLVEDVGDEYVFVITIPTSKLGVVALTKKLKLDEDVSYLVVYK